MSESQNETLYKLQRIKFSIVSVVFLNFVVPTCACLPGDLYVVQCITHSQTREQLWHFEHLYLQDKPIEIIRVCHVQHAINVWTEQSRLPCAGVVKRESNTIDASDLDGDKAQPYITPNGILCYSKDNGAEEENASKSPKENDLTALKSVSNENNADPRALSMRMANNDNSELESETEEEYIDLPAIIEITPSTMQSDSLRDYGESSHLSEHATMKDESSESDSESETEEENAEENSANTHPPKDTNTAGDDVNENNSQALSHQVPALVTIDLTFSSDDDAEQGVHPSPTALATSAGNTVACVILVRFLLVCD